LWPAAPSFFCSQVSIAEIGYSGAPALEDPDGEKFVGDDDDNRMLGRARRSPWHL
jgi:hypothetical protein